MKSLGCQLIAELYGCDEEIINQPEAVKTIFLKAAKAAKATVIDYKFHHFSPHGVSGAVIIAESHLSVHTWPEYGYCAVDIFTCGNLTDNPAALNVIKDGVKASWLSVSEMKRGILNLPDDKIKHKPGETANELIS